MNDERLPKIVSYGQLQEGVQNVGRALLRYKDNLKNIKNIGIKVSEPEECAFNCNRWTKNRQNRASR
uniref:Uncharacterized protein n=1 Tax=Octopus bimaculoides TaxID=37653 RepID=A0A0L8FVE2_OCTBM